MSAPAGDQLARLAFASRTLVALRVGAKRIPAHGPLPVIVTNANGFPVSGRLSGTATGRSRVTLRARAISVRALARPTAKLALPARLRHHLARTGRLTLRLRATVADPAGNARTVNKTATVAPRRSRS